MLFRSAAGDFDRCLQLDPEFALGWSNRSMARMHQGDLEGTIADASRALVLDP